MSGPEKREGAPEESEGAFRVVDRRRFAADGSERSPDDADREAEGEGQAQTAPDRAALPKGRESLEASSAGRAASGPEPPPELGMPRGEPYGDEESVPIEPTFSTLVMSLSTQALMCLGEIPEVMGQPPQRDMAAARSVIDLLGVLERKTQGNLDAGEAALLERILYDLRMRFVELSKT